MTTSQTLSVVEDNTSLPTSVRALKDPRASNSQQRTVVICLDGTGDRFDRDNSNVVHFVSCLKKDTPNQQVTYYQSGIGTYDEGGLQNGIGAGMDMAVGSGLGIHIKDAYRFLMYNHREGDKICLLGFSRGAYTVRCLAGMLHKVGLLPAGNIAQVNFAYDHYKDDSPDGWEMSAHFKRTFCTDVDVYFVGVWDCVASVGYIPRKLPFSKSPTNSIHYFRHAMALDEHRSKFELCQWREQDPDDSNNGDAVRKSLGAESPRASKDVELPPNGDAVTHGARNLDPFSDANAHDGGNSGPHSDVLVNGIKKGLRHADRDDEQQKLEAYFEAYENSKGSRKAAETDALEVWFMGAHADIGGGAVNNEVRHRLSQIPLRWMFRQCFECNTGILFDTASLIEQGLDLDSIYPTYQPATRPICGPAPALLEAYAQNKVPPLRFRLATFAVGDAAPPRAQEPRQLSLLCEGTEDHFDALAPVNDQLALAKLWWVLELWPVKLRFLARNGVAWVKRLGFNLGRYRPVREREPKMHWTVQCMIDEGKYRIKTRMLRDAAWQVVA
ncbi:hypothetical protein BDV95DRAFT_604304 [Massariosphaeria phaeospora]|uniref:T6SS Phospholipase effector Tle1-like catalytic domain-containing protein n=1 Tax=Massariosphaeria phaeospora TaxID=100035 RepID=A0A7C8MC37_9PLEO|nr:hypothetical protein BDV95DRAFT_604304 [Massariosphaeria phaeospora]